MIAIFMGFSHYSIEDVIILYFRLIISTHMMRQLTDPTEDLGCFILERHFPPIRIASQTVKIN